MIDALRQQLRKLLIIKNLERTAWRYLAHGTGMKSVMVIAISRLDEDRRVGEALGVHLATDVV